MDATKALALDLLDTVVPMLAEEAATFLLPPPDLLPLDFLDLVVLVDFFWGKIKLECVQINK